VEKRFPETLTKCDPSQKQDLLTHFSDALKAIASDTTKSNSDREEAMGLLEKEIIPHLTRTPRADLVTQIAAQRENIRQQEVSAEIAQLKTDITADPLEDKVEIRFGEVISKCSDTQK
jgi:hypothetical protein